MITQTEQVQVIESIKPFIQIESLHMASYSSLAKIASIILHCSKVIFKVQYFATLPAKIVLLFLQLCSLYFSSFYPTEQVQVIESIKPFIQIESLHMASYSSLAKIASIILHCSKVIFKVQYFATLPAKIILLFFTALFSVFFQFLSYIKSMTTVCSIKKCIKTGSGED